MKMKFISAVMLASALVLVPLGCKSNPASSPDGGAMNLTGAGGTFPNPIYQKWFAEYGAANSGVKINYQSVGSGAGIRQVSQGIVDFGASDGPMSDKQLAAAKGKLIHIPTVLGAVVPAYNIPGVTAELHFSSDVIADIYLGKVKKWNDKALAELNPGVELPDKEIVVVHRSDGSGTTFAFTAFLSKTNPSWKTAVGTGTVLSVDPADPKVPIVKVKVGKKLKTPKTLTQIKAEPLFAQSPLVIIGRLSVVPLTEDQWQWFLD